MQLYLRLWWNHSCLLSSKYNRSIRQWEDFKVDEDDTIQIENETIKVSGKMRILYQMIPKLIKNGHKILIFSQFKITLNILEEYFESQDILMLRLDDDTPSYMRSRLIGLYNKENSKYWVFLLSTRAGGLEINLHKVNTIIIIDSDFNPHNDLQALSRAHRIGQKQHYDIPNDMKINLWGKTNRKSLA